MYTQDMSVDEFIAKQPKYDKNRRILHPMLRAIFPLFCKVEISGLENVPPAGRTSIMINHISYLDPVVVTYAITSRYVISLSKAENFRMPLIRWLLNTWGGYPINRGSYDRKALTQTVELMKSGQLVLMAPEGTRHPEGLAPAKDGLAYVATKADAVIVPTAICGAQDWKQRFKRFRRAYASINFGKPFRFKTEGRKRIPREELALMIEEAMYQLALSIPEQFAHLRGAYSDIENATTDHIEFIDPRDIQAEQVNFSLSNA
jgi:1-acyl-sn-glycerol-3-phosphate acyltransferase